MNKYVVSVVLSRARWFDTEVIHTLNIIEADSLDEAENPK